MPKILKRVGKSNNHTTMADIKEKNQEETYLYHPGYEYDHDQFVEDVENEDTEGYEDDIIGIIVRVAKGEESAETVHSIDLSKPGIYIKELENRTYAYVFDGDIAWEYD